MQLYLQIFFTTLALAFGILHLFLYLYNRRLKSNLYFAVFLMFYALNIFFDYQALYIAVYEDRIHYLRFHRGVLPFSPIFALLFFYSIFKSRIPVQFWVISAGLVVTGLLAVFQPQDNFKYMQIFLFMVNIEAI